MTRGETDMVKRFNRIWSIAISLSLLASVPAFGDIPIVPPISGGSDNGISGPETAGPGGDNTQSGPGASTGTGNSTGTEPRQERELPLDRETRQGRELPQAQGPPREAGPAAVW